MLLLCSLTKGTSGARLGAAVRAAALHRAPSAPLRRARAFAAAAAADDGSAGAAVARAGGGGAKKGAKAAGAPEETQADVFQQRLAKVAEMRAANVEPFAYSYAPTHRCAALQEEFATLADGAEAADVSVAVAGRVTLKREFGSLTFLTLADESGTVQIYLDKKRLGERFKDLKAWVDIGDILGVRGSRTRARAGGGEGARARARVGAAGVCGWGRYSGPCGCDGTHAAVRDAAEGPCRRTARRAPREPRVCSPRRSHAAQCSRGVRARNCVPGLVRAHALVPPRARACRARALALARPRPPASAQPSAPTRASSPWPPPSGRC